MEITEIPFAKTLGLKKTSADVLALNFDSGVMNHMQTVAASAQFSLAELASGDYLQSIFPGLISKTITVLRSSRIKFKNPATSRIVALPSISETAVARFREQIEKKGRALIAVEVAVQDATGTVTCQSHFSWYVQML